ncbi:hypothetical protein DL98DRAFT_602803 [Cadophora sp. DSE1049]|nr:hypothetical protein DL98DRAFT_602803 [Cadophora sp. DSE1049]
MSSLVMIFAGNYDCVSSLLNNHPLQKRGWVFQERLMAPRVLHFGNDRIFWECNDKMLRETFNPLAVSPFSLPAIVLRSEPEPTPYLDQATIDYLQIEWLTLLDYYSTTELTYPDKDKLMAIGAVAKRFGQVLPGPYTAGLFLSSYPLGLLWHNTYGLQYKRKYKDGWNEEITLDNGRDSVYRAPSWSWASVDGRTSWPTGCENPQIFAEVIDVSVKLVNSRNPYGQLLSAEIEVRGRISSIQPLREQEIVHVPIDKSPERLIGSDELFALYFFRGKEEDLGEVAYGLVLTKGSAERYRRVGRTVSTGI